MRWVVKQQVQTDKDGNEFEVDVKQIKSRPASEKELERDGTPWKRMCPTFKLQFAHITEPDNVFEIVAQYRKPKRNETKGKTTISVVRNNSGKLEYRQTSTTESEQAEPEWRLNLKEPERIEGGGKQLNSFGYGKRTERRTVKESSGTTTIDIFFERTLPERVREQEFVNLVARLFGDVFAETESKIEAREAA